MKGVLSDQLRPKQWAKLRASQRTYGTKIIDGIVLASLAGRIQANCATTDVRNAI